MNLSSSLYELYEKVCAHDGICEKITKAAERELREGKKEGSEVLKRFGMSLEDFSDFESENELITQDLPTSPQSCSSEEIPSEVLSNEESSLAERLKSYCDAFGKEKKENLYKCATIFLDMGRLYLDKASQTEGIERKQNFIKSSALITGAMVRFRILDKIVEEDSAVEILTKLNTMMLSTAGASQRFNIIDLSSRMKKTLAVYRRREAAELDEIVRINDDDAEDVVLRKKLQKIDKVRKICERNTQNYTELMREIGEECEKVLGVPPCRYVIAGLGSLARNEVTLYSDFEHVIVLEDGVDKSANYSSVKEYFRWFSTIFHVVVISLGETIIKSVDIKSIGDLYSQDHSKNWFSDEYTPCGVSFDGMMPHACKIPLGRQLHTKLKKHALELIQPVDIMANFLSKEEELKNGYFLKDVLGRSCFVHGDYDVYENFLAKSRQMLHLERVDDVAKHELKHIFLNKNEAIKDGIPILSTQGKSLKVTNYRPLTALLGCVSRVCKLRSASSFEIVDELLECGVINRKDHLTLMHGIAVTMEGRMKSYQKTGHQRNAISSVEWVGLVGERCATDCLFMQQLFTSLVRSLLVRVSRGRQGSPKLCFPDFENEICKYFAAGMHAELGKHEKATEILLKLICDVQDEFQDTGCDALGTSVLLKMAFTSLGSMFICLCTTEVTKVANSLQVLYEGASLDQIRSGLERCEWTLKKVLELKAPHTSSADLEARELLCGIYCLLERHNEGIQEFENWYKIYCKLKARSSWRCLARLWLYELEMRLKIMETDDLIKYIENCLADETDFERICALELGMCQALLKSNAKSEAEEKMYELMMNVKHNAKRLTKSAYHLYLAKLRDVQVENHFSSQALIATYLLSDTVAHDFVDEFGIINPNVRKSERMISEMIRKSQNPKLMMDELKDARKDRQSNWNPTLPLSQYALISFSHKEMMESVHVAVQQCRTKVLDREKVLSYITSLMGLFESVPYGHTRLANEAYWEAPAKVKFSRALQPFIFGYLVDVSSQQNTPRLVQNQGRILKALFGCSREERGWKVYQTALSYFTSLNIGSCARLLWRLLHYGNCSIVKKSCELLLTAVVANIVTQKRRRPAYYFSKTREISRKQAIWLSSIFINKVEIGARVNSISANYYMYTKDLLTPVYNLAVECVHVNSHKACILLWKLLYAPNASNLIKRTSMRLFFVSFIASYKQTSDPLNFAREVRELMK